MVGDGEHVGYVRTKAEQSNHPHHRVKSQSLSFSYGARVFAALGTFDFGRAGNCIASR
jgi:hypothetical protein